MYYIIETKYVGPNEEQHEYVDVNTIEISTAPAITNRSREECIEGWCGTTNDWAVYAHGEYATIEEARAAIAEKFGDVRDSDHLNGDRFEPDSGDVVEVYKPGKYYPWSMEAVDIWAAEFIQDVIEADTTDERIAGFAAESEAEANRDGYTLGGWLERLMLERRQELRDEKKGDNPDAKGASMFGNPFTPGPHPGPQDAPTTASAPQPSRGPSPE